MINKKTPEEIKIMAEGGKILAQIREMLVSFAKPGITTKELDKIAYGEMIRVGGKPSFLNFNGYPASICTSINNQVVHGIPSNRRLAEGDVIGIDVGIEYKGFHNDTATTVGIGNIKSEEKKLLNITKQSLNEAIKLIKPGIHLGDIQNKIQSVIEKERFGIVRDLTGHGVGKDLQEEPAIPNYGKKGSGPILEVGMVLAIEPMVTLGKGDIFVEEDGWTISTRDGSVAAHFEHTIAVTEKGYKVLTS